MERRNFIKLVSLMLTTPIIANNLNTTSWNIIKQTLEHLFPKSKVFVGATALNLDIFLQLISKDRFFDKSDLEFLIQGAKMLYKIEPQFLQLSSNEREILLRKFEQRRVGQNWLSTLMRYGLEGMLSDPIYGGNNKQLGWKALHHNTGLPQPRKKYGI